MIFTMLMFLFGTKSFAFVDGQEFGNGAGGYKNAKGIVTYQSAKLPVDGTSLELKDIPGLTDLAVEIQKMPLKAEQRSEMLRWIYPSGKQRTYYKLSDKRLNGANRKQIIKEYSKLMHISEKNVVIFAVTNKLGQTFLLPEFYKLNTIQQEAILLHEGLWFFDMQFSYKDVVTTEIAAQALFQDKGASYASYFQFYRAIGEIFSHKEPHPETLVRAAINYDQTQTPQILMQDLLGSDFVECYRHERWQSINDGSSCTDHLVVALLGSMQGSKHAMFDQALVDTLSRHPQFYLCFLPPIEMKDLDFLSDDLFIYWKKNSVVMSVRSNDQEVRLWPNQIGRTQVIVSLTDGYGKFWGNLALCDRTPATTATGY